MTASPFLSSLYLQRLVCYEGLVSANECLSSADTDAASNRFVFSISSLNWLELFLLSLWCRPSRIEVEYVLIGCMPLVVLSWEFLPPIISIGRLWAYKNHNVIIILFVKNSIPFNFLSQLKILTKVRHYNRLSVFFGHAKYLPCSFSKIFTQDHVKDEDKQTYVKHDTMKGWSKIIW